MNIQSIIVNLRFSRSLLCPDEITSRERDVKSRNSIGRYLKSRHVFREDIVRDRQPHSDLLCFDMAEPIWWLAASFRPFFCHLGFRVAPQGAKEYLSLILLNNKH